MRYQIKQHLFSLAGRFDILDESGEKVLEVLGKVMSLGAQYSIRGAGGRELIAIRQKLWSLLPRFVVTRDGEVIATVVREWTLFEPRYTIHTTEGENLLVRGSFWEYDYRFVRAGETVARVSRSVWSLADSYGVEVYDPACDALALASVLAIDSALSQSRRS